MRGEKWEGGGGGGARSILYMKFTTAVTRLDGFYRPIRMLLRNSGAINGFKFWEGYTDEWEEGRLVGC